MQAWIEAYHVIFWIGFVFLWTIVSWFIALLSGWRLLAQRFRTKRSSFTRQKWYMQSARTRFGTHYNGCLTIGADAAGLYLAPMLMFRSGHPPLFIP